MFTGIISDIGTVTARKSLMQQWAHGAHGNTYGGNPICCAAALATIELVENAVSYTHLTLPTN